MNPKIKTLKQAQRTRRLLKKKRKKIVFTNGCFDILHIGHLDYLRKARRCGDYLIVGLNSDSSIRRIKGKNRPINPVRERAEVLSEFNCVDCVVVFHEDTPIKLIKSLCPDVLVKGADWPMNEIVGREEVKSCGGCVKRVKLVPGRSTTALLRKIAKNFKGK